MLLGFGIFETLGSKISYEIEGLLAPYHLRKTAKKL